MSAQLILRGQLVRLANRSMFKLGVVIGPSKAPGKVHICVWQNASRAWSQPQAEDAKWLDRLFPGMRTAREREVIRRAQKSVADRGEVAWSGGAQALRKVEP
jgi:hypothetical protein